MTKVAIILTGLPRIYEKSIAFWENVVAEYNADIFIHTWDHDINFSSFNEAIKRLDPKSVKIDKLENYDYKKYEYRSRNGINVYNIYSSWESAKRGYQLMESHYQIMPDTIVRARLDLYSPHLDLLDIPALVLPISPNKWPECFHYNRQFLMTHEDLICYGPAKYIKKYCHLIDHMSALMESDTDLLMISERILAAHLWSQCIPYFSQLLDYEIVRE